jgi:hypothetical protein
MPKVSFAILNIPTHSCWSPRFRSWIDPRVGQRMTVLAWKWLWGVKIRVVGLRHAVNLSTKRAGKRRHLSIALATTTQRPVFSTRNPGNCRGRMWPTYYNKLGCVVDTKTAEPIWLRYFCAWIRICSWRFHASPVKNYCTGSISCTIRFQASHGG